MKNLLLICGFLLLLSGCTGSEDIAWGPEEETSPEVETPEVQKAEVSEQAESVVSFHNPVLIKELTIKELTVSPLDWPSEEEGTCVASAWLQEESPDLPLCNPVLNIANDDPSDSITYTISAETLVYITNFRADPSSSFEMTMEEFVIAFEEKDFYFKYVAFDIEFDNGQVKSIKEIYIP